MKKLVTLLLPGLFFLNLSAQDINVTGRITSFGEIPLVNFPVRAKKSGETCLSDSAGYFRIKCLEKDQLIFKGKPFVSRKIKIRNSDSLYVNLFYIEGEKSEEMVVDAGYMDPEAIAYATRELSEQNNNFYQYNNIYDLLRSQFSDIEIGDGNIIYIRGQAPSLLLDNSALLIVDGIEVRDISGIQPVNIKSVQVLKGTEAAFYGSRGANGVVVITRK